mmetsp:Transcript_130593/g.291487  ORF Transcript_130593/g.291487 Transcript_130593/m.291487 type:complete len:109 (+) Transcript_130593:91-417(+)
MGCMQSSQKAVAVPAKKGEVLLGAGEPKPEDKPAEEPQTIVEKVVEEVKDMVEGMKDALVGSSEDAKEPAEAMKDLKETVEVKPVGNDTIAEKQSAPACALCCCAPTA